MHLSNKYLLFFVFVIGLVSFASAQETIWSENFNSQTDGLDNGNFGPLISANEKWTIEVINQGGDWTGASDYFKVNNDLMEARDTDNRCEWTSAQIDISGYSDVTASVEISEVGNLELQDTLALYYVVDGSALTTFTTNGLNVDDFTSLTASTTIPSGNSLQIIIHAKNNADSEYLQFDNVLVSGDSGVINPEPSAHVSNVSFSSVTDDAFTVSWTDASTGNLPLAYLVKISEGTVTDPVDGTAEADAVTVLNIVQGVQTASFSSLSASTTYNVSIYPYSNSGSNIDYKLSAASNQVTTDDTPIGGAILISEIADPNNSSSGRYVELYNYSNSSIDLTGWKLQRYTNDNETANAALNLSGTIGAYTTFVIGKTTFSSVYGFAPDMTSSNTVVDSNGDDNIELLDASGNRSDIFGVPGEDGTGTNHEFTDGRAERNNGVVIGNTTYTASEWTLDNIDGEGDGATDAPGGFDPGTWIGGKTVVNVTSNTSEDNYQIGSNNFLSVSNNAALTITNGGQFDGEIIVESGSGITISSGTLNNTSSLSLKDGAYLFENGGTINNSGTFTVERNTTVDAEVYNFLSSPVANADLETTLVDSDVVSYDPTDFVDDGMGNTDNTTGWSYKTTGSLEVGIAYATTGSDTDASGVRSFTGTPNSGTYLIGVVTSSGGSPFGESWNLVGNPYPSPIQIGDFLTTNTTQIENGVYLWDDSIDDYVTKNSGMHGTELIAIAQGFFVQAKSDTDISFTNAMRRGNTATFYKWAAPQIMDLILENDNGKKNFTSIAFAADAMDGKDNIYDSKKMFGNTNISIYSLLNNEAYALQGLSIKEEQQIPLGIRTSSAGKFQLSISSNSIDASYEIFLEDKVFNTMTVVSDVIVEFSLNEGITEDRFVLHVRTRESVYNQGLSNEINYTLVNGVISVANEDNSIKTIQLRDASGRLLYFFNGEHQDISNLPHGVYFLEVNKNTRTKHVKFVF